MKNMFFFFTHRFCVRVTRHEQGESTRGAGERRWKITQVWQVWRKVEWTKEEMNKGTNEQMKSISEQNQWTEPVNKISQTKKISQAP